MPSSATLEEDELGRETQHSYAQLEAELRAMILDGFDPDGVEQELQASLERRALLRAANEANDLHWDYSPFFDATRQYCR